CDALMSWLATSDGQRMSSLSTWPPALLCLSITDVVLWSRLHSFSDLVGRGTLVLCSAEDRGDSDLIIARTLQVIVPDCMTRVLILAPFALPEIASPLLLRLPAPDGLCLRGLISKRVATCINTNVAVDMPSFLQPRGWTTALHWFDPHCASASYHGLPVFGSWSPDA